MKHGKHFKFSTLYWDFPRGSVVKNLPANAGDVCLVPELGRFTGEGNGNPLQYSSLGESHGRRSLTAYSRRGHKRVGRDLVSEQQKMPSVDFLLSLYEYNFNFMEDSKELNNSSFSLWNWRVAGDIVLAHEIYINTKCTSGGHLLGKLPCSDKGGQTQPIHVFCWWSSPFIPILWL